MVPFACSLELLCLVAMPSNLHNQLVGLHWPSKLCFLLVSWVAFLDLGDHDLLVVTYPGVLGEFFELLEELVAVQEVDLSELLPLRVLDALVHILPEPFSEICFEIFIGGV